jgi:hypothetical protein
MGTELGTIENTGPNGVTLSVTRFFGGKNAGPCVQLSAKTKEGNYGYVQLSASDIIALLPILKTYIIDYALEGKKKEAEEAIKGYSELQKTIVKDMRDVSAMAISLPVLNTASLLCFGGKEFVLSDEIMDDTI